MSMPDDFVTSRKTPGALAAPSPAAAAIARRAAIRIPTARLTASTPPSRRRLRSASRLPLRSRTASRNSSGPPGARQVLADELAVRIRVRKRLLSVARVVHAVERQRLDRLTGDRVLVGVLVPAVEHDEPVARPALRHGRQSGGIELQPHGVASLHHDVAIVGRRQERAHVAEPRVEPGHVGPAGLARDVVVDEHLRAAGRLDRHPREAAERELGGGEGAHGVTRVGAGSSSTVYAIRSQEIARFVRMRTRGSLAHEDAGEVDRHRLRLAGRISHRGDRRLPASRAVRHLEDGRLGAQVAALGQRDVDRRVGVEDPAGQVEHHALRGAGLGQRQHELVRRHDPLVARRREPGEVDAVQRGDLGRAVAARRRRSPPEREAARP